MGGIPIPLFQESVTQQYFLYYQWGAIGKSRGQSTSQIQTFLRIGQIIACKHLSANWARQVTLEREVMVVEKQSTFH